MRERKVRAESRSRPWVFGVCGYEHEPVAIRMKGHAQPKLSGSFPLTPENRHGVTPLLEGFRIPKHALDMTFLDPALPEPLLGVLRDDEPSLGSAPPDSSRPAL